MPFTLTYLGKAGPAGYTEEMLKAFLDLKVEEGLNLDYKNIAAASNPDKLATIATAFANAEGGLLVLGVSEKEELDEKGKPVRIWPGEITWGPKSTTREKVESSISARTHPRILGLRIYPVRNAAGEGVFLVDVPQSPKPPHQGPDGKYYLRYNFQNQPMEHHQVEDLFFRRMKPVIRPLLEVLDHDTSKATLTLRIGFANEGGSISKHTMFFGEFLNCARVVDLGKRFFLVISPVPSSDRQFTVFYHSPIEVIHPRMVSYAGTIEIGLLGALTVTIMVGAEGMPTTRFLSGISPAFLVALNRDFKKEPLSLSIVSPEEEYDEAASNQVFRQVGIDPEEFMRAIEKVVAASDPDSIRMALEGLEEISRKYQ